MRSIGWKPGAPGAPHSDRFPEASPRFAWSLLALYLGWWALWAFNPRYPNDWLLENVLVAIAVPLACYSHLRIRFSAYALGALFLFLCLHALGAHYTYAEVPYRQWLGLAMDGRNQFDRGVHFLFGLLVMPAYLELLSRRAALQGVWRAIVPVAFLMAQSELYEIIEWQAALRFGGELGQAYLGTQGDIWDAQKDSAVAAIGAIVGLAAYKTAFRLCRRPDRPGPR